VSAAETAPAATLSGSPLTSRRAVEAVLDVIGALGLVMLLPVVIIVLGLPIVLGVRLAMWVFGLM
jgi:hypothetical protein